MKEEIAVVAKVVAVIAVGVIVVCFLNLLRSNGTPDIMSQLEFNKELADIVENREERVRLKNAGKEGFWAVKVCHTYLVDAGGTFFVALTAFSNNEKEALEAGKKWYRESNTYTPLYRVTFEATFCEEYDPDRSEHVELKKRLKDGAVGY